MYMDIALCMFVCVCVYKLHISHGEIHSNASTPDTLSTSVMAQIGKPPLCLLWQVALHVQATPRLL